MLDDLPEAEAADQQDRDEEQRHQDEKVAATRIGAAQHVAIDRSAGAQDEWFGERGEPEIDRLLADRGLPAEPVQVGGQLLLLGDQAISLVQELAHVVIRGRDADRLGEREEREQEGDDDRPEQQRQPA